MLTIRHALCAAAIGSTLFAAGSASAFPYEVFVEIETEEDLYDLRAREQIGDDTLTTLVELMQRGVDLNKATRGTLYTLPNLTYADVDAIITYREEGGPIGDPIALVAAGVLTDRKLFAIAPFIVLADVGSRVPITGMARYQTIWTSNDDRMPAMSLQARAKTLDNLRIGIAAVATRNRIAAPIADPNRQALTADGLGTRLQVPKAYAFYDTDDFAVALGSFQVGFGQRLTFDNTNQVDPNGIYPSANLFRKTSLTRRCKESAGELDVSPCSGVDGDQYVTPDFTWRDDMLGVAAGLKDIKLGSGTLQMYGFGSYTPRSIYQYEIYNRDICDDPRNDNDPNCRAPDVYNTQADPFTPTSRFSYVTLPNLYAETIGGGNVTYNFSRRNRIGITGYGASVKFLAEGLNLDFQEWSRMPFGGPFGAVGANGALGFGNVDLFAEVAQSFDSMIDGGGGTAAIARSVFTLGKKNVFELNARYYDQAFANPHARPMSAADEFEGIRARDEAGVRAIYNAVINKRWNLRSAADVWTNPSQGSLETLLYVRNDIDFTDQWRFGVWAKYQNKDLQKDGRMECFEVSTDNDENGETIPCAGQKMQLSGRMRFAPNRDYWFSAQYQHEVQDDQRYDDGYRQDVSIYLNGTAKLGKDFRLRGRVRYLFEDITDNMYLEQSLWTFVDATYRLRQRDRLRIRYDSIVWLDERSGTLDRVPSPEHWLWLEYEAKF